MQALALVRSRHGRRSRGQSVVEFALLLPMLLLVTLGVIDAARVFAAYISLTNGVREAVIFAGGGTAASPNYAKWCTDPAGKAPTPAVSVPCPHDATAANKSADPNNIAYRIDAEAGGLDPSIITLRPPTCDNGSCNSSSTKVTVVASYRVTVLTPIIGAILGGSVPMTASITTAILR